MTDKVINKTVNDLVVRLIEEAGDSVNQLTCLALELSNSHECNYYFVQHDERLLFWAHDFKEPKLIYENVEGVKSDSHISWCLSALLNQNTTDICTNTEIALEAQYWFVDTVVCVAYHPRDLQC